MRKEWVIVVGVLLFPFISAGVFIEPLASVYNYGDQLTAQTNLIPSSATSGHYTVDLKCGSNLTINIFNQFLTLAANIEEPVTVTTQLVSPLLTNLTVPCALRASYGGETATSNSFTLSKTVSVEAELAFDELSPSKPLAVSGAALKESGVQLNGFVELFVPTLNLYKSGTVGNGLFNISTVIPATAQAGTHNITLIVYDSDAAGKQLNRGSWAASFTVEQVLKDITIVAENEQITPGTEFVFHVDAVDQAGDPMRQDVSVLISEPKGLPFIKKVIKPAELQKVPFSLNNTPGYWSVEATVGEITKRKLFYLSEIQKVQTSLINRTLFVTNIGNAPYKGPLEITIGSYVEVEQLSLGIGETKEYTLHAPDGTYAISISEGGEAQALGNTFLTGNAVKVTDLREDVLSTVTNPLIWWLAAILFVLIIVLVQIKLRLQRHPPTPLPAMPVHTTALQVKKPVVPEPAVHNEPPQSVTQSLSWKPVSSPASPSVVSGAQLFASTHEGIRERATVLALRISGDTSPYAAQTITTTLSLAQETGAKIYMDGDVKIVLFSPRLTRVYENEILAVQVGKRIESLLLEHNRLYNDRLLFGLGLANGEIISEIEGGKFHFTSTGNLISSAKRIAQSAVMKLLLSDSVRKSVGATIKTEQADVSGLWEVTRVVDRSRTSEFMRRFSER